ncbi:hypothetical protein BKA64DRAFT_684455 [Cadophora sp. MPI-SDFR-AT-0126]|nr:hypothetical protein BKA64DRAFT_684455 [Leotiomycetes sp. MPI-SDFR-AT-0126]
MRFSNASLVVFSTIMIGRVFSEELDSNDVPTACTTICKPIVELTSICDVDNDTDKTESDDAIEATCICSNTSFNVGSIAALCASCISQNGATTNDMTQILSACSFTSTSYAPSATALVAAVTVSASKPTVTGSATGTASASTSTSTASDAAIGRHAGYLGYITTVCLVFGFGGGIM